jgi:S-adenosylmethionine synthetase
MPALLPDGKAQVTVRYRRDADGVPEAVAVERVVVSSQHRRGTDMDELRAAIVEHVVRAAIPTELLDDATMRSRDFVLVNPTGRFEVGGPMGDAGLTGRKIIVDTYGGMARHGGGAFSGKDPTKVDRSAAYAVRQIAKAVVAAGLAKRCEAQVAYAIGVAHPMSIMVDTFGTSEIDPAKIETMVRDVFDMRPAAIMERLDLRRPIYRRTAAYGHFGRTDGEGFTWEEVEPYATELRRAAGA